MKGRRFNLLLVAGLELLLLRTPAVLLAAPPAPPSPSTAARPVLLPLPEPDLEGSDPAARRQIEEQRAAFEKLLAKPDATPETLAEVSGRLGQLYLLYGFDDVAGSSFENARRLTPEDYRWSYYLGVVAERAGESKRAVSAFQRVLELRPGDTPCLLRLGRTAITDGRIDDAESRYREALKVGAGAAALYGLGRVAMARGQYDMAVKLFEQVLAAQPEATSAHYQLGLAYRQLRDLDRARDQFAQRGTQDPVFPDPLVDSLSLLATGAGIPMDLGNREVAQGHPEAAVPFYRKAVEAAPDNLQARQALASALAETGYIDEALKLYLNLLERQPDNPVSHFNVGNLYLARKELESAAREFRKAVELAPDYADAQYNLALVLEQLGHTQEAIEQARHAVGADPEGKQPKELLASLLMQSGRLEDLQEAASVAPELVSAHMALGAALGRVGRYAEAAQSFSRATEMAPGNEQAWFGKATALLLADQEAGALKALDNALRRFPASLPLQHALARLLAAANDSQVRDGRRALDLAVKVFRSYATIEHGQTLAMAQAAVGEYEQAAAMQRKVIERAKAVGRTDLLPELQAQLASYLAGKPVRAPWLAEVAKSR